MSLDSASESRRLLYKTLRETVSIDENIRFVSELLKSYKGRAERHDSFVKSLDKIREKEYARELYLGIVGEFSSGKSTLINALLRDEVLKTDVIQGTTSAATVIKYGVDLDARVRFRNGETKTFAEEGKKREKFADYIQQFTAEEETAKTVAEVTLFHPCKNLREGLVIIDTPGINVSNSRHIEVTAETIRESCDAAIVIIPADIPVSQSLTSFLRAYLQDVIHRCIFVVTKSDIVRESKKRERLLKTIGIRLQKELAIENPRVLPAASQVVIDSMRGEKDERLDDNKALEFISEFEKTEEQIFDILKEQRMLIQIERISLLMSMLLEDLKNDLNRLEEKYALQHRALIENQVMDIRSFLSEEMTRYSSGISSNSVRLRSTARETVDRCRKGVIKEIRGAIYNAKNEEELRKVVKDQAGGIIKKYEKQMTAGINGVIREVYVLGHGELEEFERHFNELYKSLATLGGNITSSGKSLNRKEARELTGSFRSFSGEINSIVDGDQKKEDWIMGGGMYAGAIIGSTVLPVIGTIIGGFIGAVVGAFFTPSLDKLKDKYWEKLNDAVCIAFEKADSMANKSTWDAIGKTKAALNKVMDNYYLEYSELVKEMIARDELEARSLEKVREEIGEDLGEIDMHYNKLADARKKLRCI